MRREKIEIADCRTPGKPKKLATVVLAIGKKTHLKIHVHEGGG